MVYRVTKRIFDILFSIISIILFIPFWIIIPTLIKIDSPGGVIFKQKRIGINSRYFTIYKFRTMKKGTADIPTDRLKNQSSLNTRIGTILRRLSIDEIPQLINILKGDMSFVGPRPALYNQELLIRLRKEKGVDKVRPGVTGLAQISGRDQLSIPDKVMYDQLYIKDASILLDIKIFLVTVKAALTGKGAN
ncbi:Undecaprenyl phosphate N,N'-diacetylbacillosamine 1-phosphate transferase [subsurface metagenome]